MLDDAKTLVAYLKESHEWGYVNFAKDWKLTTLFIGGNDLCAYCKDRVTHQPSYFVIMGCCRTHRWSPRFWGWHPSSRFVCFHNVYVNRLARVTQVQYGQQQFDYSVATRMLAAVLLEKLVCSLAATTIKRVPECNTFCLVLILLLLLE